MKIAVVETGGKQYVVTNDTVLTVEKIEGADAGKKIVFDKVLVIDDGTTQTVGAPYIAGATVNAEVIEAGKGKKIIVEKFRAKSNYHKKRGHRQLYTKVRILEV